MRFFNLTRIFLLFLITVNWSLSAKMLLIMPSGTRSHYIYYMAVVRVLTQRGHQFAVITPFKSKDTIPNVREVVLSNNFVDVVFEDVFDDNIISQSIKYATKYVKECPKILLEQQIQEILNQNFDLIFVAYAVAECFFPYIYHKQVPFVFLYANEMYGPLSEFVGNLDLPSIVPNVFIPLVYPLSFVERIQSTLYLAFESYLSEYYTLPLMEKECRSLGLMSADTPSLSTIQRNASLAIINSVVALDYPPRPYSPNVVFAGGIHITPRGKIDKELEQWLDESGDYGFLLFSLGSAITPSYMKEKHKTILINVFKSLKQRILWKWDLPDMEGLPPNVKISKWVPQQDILSHPKLKLFITHGGLLSTQESTYFKVPVIGMPVFGDQFHNMMRGAKEGWASIINWEDLDEDSLNDAIRNAIGNPGVLRNLAKRSNLMKDLPRPPSAEVVYWVEYALRHNGTPHLKTPLPHMAWYEITNFDVWMFVICVFMVSNIISFCLLWFLLTKCCGCGKNKIRKEKRNT